MSRKFCFSREKYFPVPLDEVGRSKPRKFPLFIYLELNDHLMMVSHEGEALPLDRIDKYEKSGLRYLWCPHDFREAYLEFMSDGPGELAASILDVLQAEGFSELERRQTLQEIARQMISVSELLQAGNEQETQAALKRCEAFSSEIIRVASELHQVRSLSENLKVMWKMNLEHSTTVSSISMLLSLVSGYTLPGLLMDIAFGALFHDIGYARIDPALLMIPERKYTAAQFKAYQAHVGEGIRLLTEKGVRLPLVTKNIIEEHHERYNGTGFPKKTKGATLHNYSQLVGIADLITDLMTGRIDGIKRTPAKAFSVLKHMSTDPMAPDPFQPELVNSLFKVLDQIDT